MFHLGNLRQYAGACGIQRQHLRLCAGPLVLRALDYGITLCGQSPAYWAGEFHRANEGSHLLRWCLQQHPLLFVAVAAVLSLVYTLFILCWPEQPARLLAAVLVFGHAFGVFTWIAGSPVCGPVAAIAILYLCWLLLEGDRRHPDASPSRVCPEG